MDTLPCHCCCCLELGHLDARACLLRPMPTPPAPLPPRPRAAQPFSLLHNAPGTLALGAGMALPLVFTAVREELFAAWRSRFVASFRLYAILFASHAGIPALLTEASWPRQTQGCPPVTLLWRLSGAECLAAAGCGFLLHQVRGAGCASRARTCPAAIWPARCPLFYSH